MHYARWNELDVFIVKKDEWQMIVKRMSTMSKTGHSGYMPVFMRGNIRDRTLERGCIVKSVGIRWERL